MSRKEPADDITTSLDPTVWFNNTKNGLRETSILDWIECAVLLFGPKNINTLIDAWIESGNRYYDQKQFTNYADSQSDKESEPTDSETAQSEFFNSTIAGLRFRENVLQLAYPFKIDDSTNVMALKVGCNNSQSNLYAHLLLISMLEQYGRNKLFSSLAHRDHGTLRLFFERLVTEALRHKGYKCAHIGTGGPSGNFASKVTQCMTDLALGTPGDRAAFQKYAKDGGVDIIAGHFWGDHQSREVVLLVQCTVSPPDEWQHKINEAASVHWSNLLNQASPQISCLATPLPTTADSLNHLTLLTSHTFFDRIRLSLAGQGMAIQSIPDYDKYHKIVTKALKARNISLPKIF